jgi:hypothetical protein
MSEFYSLWEKLLNERELKELHFARLYAAEFHHGTDGHNRLLLLDKLAKLLDRAYESHECLSELLYEEIKAKE